MDRVMAKNRLSPRSQVASYTLSRLKGRGDASPPRIYLGVQTLERLGALRFRIEGRTIPNPSPDDPDDISTAAVVTLGEEQGHDPDQLLNRPDPQQRTATEEAADWLQSLLAHRPQPLADIKRLAREEGITDKTLRLARERLGVITETDPHAVGRGRHTQWRLPGQTEP